MGGDGGASTGAGSLPTTKTSSPVREVDGLPVFGPARPPHMLEYGNQGSTSWGFDGLLQSGADVTAEAEANDAADRLMDNVDANDNDEEGDDASSTRAEMDTSADFGGNEEFGAYTDAPEYGTHTQDWSAGRNTPVDSPSAWYDDHAAYSTAHEHQDADFTALHLEDAGMTGQLEEEMPAVEISLDPPTPDRVGGW